MSKLGCYVSENDILSALSVMGVYFAIHQVFFKYHLCAITQHTTEKPENSEQNKLAEGIHGDSGTRSTSQVPPASPVVMGPSYSFLLLGPVEEASRASYFPCGVSWGEETFLVAHTGSQIEKYKYFTRYFV